MLGIAEMVWALYMVMFLPDGVPIQLRNVEVFPTEQQCEAVGSVKSVSIAQGLADETGVPVRFMWKCIREKPEKGVSL